MTIHQKPQRRFEKGKGRRLNIPKIDSNEAWQFTRNGQVYDHWREPALQAMHQAAFLAYARYQIGAARQARLDGRTADAATSLQLAASFRRGVQSERIKP